MAQKGGSNTDKGGQREVSCRREADGDRECGEAIGTGASERGEDSALRRKELQSAIDLIRSAPQDEIEDIGVSVQLAEMVKLASYSGMLPPPEIFYKFSEADRERICRWNDASTIDESMRQDRLADAQVRLAEKGMVLTMRLTVLFALLSFVLFLVTSRIESFLLLSIPVANVLTALLKPAEKVNRR